MIRDNHRSAPGFPLVEVDDLRVHFPMRRSWGPGRALLRAVDGVTLRIDAGTCLGLVGESGSGKSTLGRAVLRLIEPTSGRVRFGGVDVGAASRGALKRLRRDMQIVFQDPIGSLNARHTIGRIIAEPLIIHRLGTRRGRNHRVAELLDRVGLRAEHASRYPHEFSGGQRQRIGIARAIALQPRFIVCDEPVSALDVSVQAQILNLLADLRRDLGLTYLFIAHNLAVVRQCCDRVAVMSRGVIVETAPTDDLFDRPQHAYTRALLAAVPGLEPRSTEVIGVGGLSTKHRAEESW
jgi:ABC-type oligopeptide transport system ATPase subunit